MQSVGAPRGASFRFGVLAILAGQIASGVVALLLEACYARLLGPESRGLLSVCLMSVAFAALVGAAGGEGSIVFWSSRERGIHGTWLPAVLLWGVLGSSAAGALWWLAYWKLHLPVLRGVSPYTASLVLLNIPAAILFAYCMALWTGLERFPQRSIGALSRQLAALAGFLALLGITGRSPVTALWGAASGYLAASLLTVVLLWRHLSGFWAVRTAKPNLLPTLAYGLRGQIGNLASFFTYRLDVFVINYFLPAAQLGYYALGVTLSEVLWQFPAAAASVLFPRTARTEGEDSARFTCLVMRQVLLVSSVSGALLAAVAPFAIPLVFGARFTTSVPVVLALLPGTLALSLAKVGCSDLAGRGKNGYSSVFALACLVFTVAFDLLLIPRWGILGAAVASSAAYFLDSLLVLAALRHELKVAWPELLLPSADDLATYRAAWHRLRSVALERTRPLVAAGPGSAGGE